MQAEATRGAPDQDRLEARGLEQDPRGLVGDLGVEAPHHAGERDALLAVADQQIAGDQRALHAIERDELLAIFGVRDLDDTGGQRLGVERVQRLPELEHHVVRDVDEVRDRSHAHTAEPLRDPPGQRGATASHRDAFDDARDVPGASIGARDRELDVRRSGAYERREIDVGQHELAAEHRDQLARHAEMAEHVPTICRCVDLEHPVVEAERNLRAHPKRRAVILGQHDDARVIVSEAELILGAQHARRHDALDRLGSEREPARQRRADLRPQHATPGRWHIGRAAHDLGRSATLLGDHVDQRQLVGLRVRLLADHLGHHDAGEPRAEVRHALDLEATACQCARALLDRRLLVEIAQLEEPAPQDLHD